jgi:hypothetical protein
MEISPEIDRLLREAKRKKSMKPEMIESIKEEIKESLEGVSAVNEVFKRIELLKIKGDKGDKGDKGEDGYTPVKGKDYFDGKDGYTPVKGKDYFDGKDGRDGVDGKSIRGRDGKDGKDGKSIKGEPGKDGSPDTPYEIRDKLASLRGNERLDAKAIKNLAKEVGSISITGMGNGTATTVTEHIADTLIHVPIYIQEIAPSNPTLNDLWVDTSV